MITSLDDDFVQDWYNDDCISLFDKRESQQVTTAAVALGRARMVR